MLTTPKSSKNFVIVQLLFAAALITSTAGWSVVVQSSEPTPSVKAEVNSTPRFQHGARVDFVKMTQTERELENLKEKIHLSINEYRASRGLSPFSLNAQINHQAEIHSQNMAQQVVKFSHQGFKDRIQALEGKIAYRSAAENVAFNQGYQDPAQKAIAGWKESEGHHQNMIGDFNLTGIGIAKDQQGAYYFTQIFIKEQ